MPYSRFEKRVLVAIMGTSPAVLTETLHALMAPNDHQRDVFVPTEVIVVTTSTGRRYLEEEVLAPAARVSPYAELQNQLMRHGILNGPLVKPRIVVPTVVVSSTVEPDMDSAVEIEDAHSRTDLIALADALLEEVKAATKDDNCAMVLSLSGGKKGMSHIAGQVMSLCGRPHDRLVHIAAIPAGLESCSSFFFPSDDRYVLHTWALEDGTEGGCYAHEVSLELAQQPYLPLRGTVQKALTAEHFERSSFTDTMAYLGQQLAPCLPSPLVLNLQVSDRSVTIARPGAGVDEVISSMTLEPQQFAYLWTLAEFALRGQSIPNPMTDEAVCEFLKRYERLVDGGWDPRQRAGKAMPWFGGETIPGTANELNQFDIASVSNRFRPVNLDHIRRPKQSHLVAYINKALSGMLPLDVSALDFHIPAGKPGRGGGLSEHRLPNTWQVNIIGE